MAKSFSISVSALAILSSILVYNVQVHISDEQPKVDSVAVAVDPEPEPLTLNEKVVSVKEKSAAEQRDSVMSWARRQLGVRELTGRNDGKEVEEYLANVGFGKGYSWCAAFVRYGYDYAGVKTTITAWSPTAHNAKNIIWAKSKMNKPPPMAADAFTVYYSSKKRIGHTGFVEKELSGGLIQTIEGNTNGDGSSDGDGVYRRRRSLKQIHSITRWVKETGAN